MFNTLKTVSRSLTYNFKQLIGFEVIYRLLGLAVIFPVSRFLFDTSIRLSGLSYITNSSLVSYLFKPTTIGLMLLLLVIFALYVTIELVFLSVIFDYGYNERDLSVRVLFHVGIKKTVDVLRTYHVNVMIPALIFFLVVELMHVVGIAQTVNVPDIVIQQIQSYQSLMWMFVALIVILVLFFMESIFTVPLLTIDQVPKTTRWKQHRILLKKRRVRIVGELAIVNAIVNGVLYFLYIAILFGTGLFVRWIKGEDYVVSFVLTIFYSLYSVIAFVSTITLIPINYAFVMSWYYERQRNIREHPRHSFMQVLRQPLIASTFIKRAILLTLFVIFSLNLAQIAFRLQGDPPVEILNYPLIAAHRGASWDAPENTLAAIELAIEAKADFVEIDVRSSKDGIPVLIHDRTTGRTTNDALNRNVHDLTLAELKQLDAGSWFSNEFMGETIPTLEEALVITQGRINIFLDLKVSTLAFEKEVMAIVQQYNMAQDVTLLSFNNLQLKRFKDMNEEVQTLLLITSFFGDMERLAAYSYIDMFGLHESLFKNNPQYRDIIQNQRKKVFVYTVNGERRLKDVVNLNADGIITDQPILARQAALSKNTRDELIELMNALFRRG